MGVHAWLQVMAGQGTMALELLEQFSELEPESYQGEVEAQMTGLQHARQRPPSTSIHH